jgi:lactate permease
MVHSGMIQSLAEAAAAMGPAWLFFAPFIGVLGTFVTGSATSSNILFSGFQEATAKSLALPVATLQGAQNFGAAGGNMVCPHNIIAGGATVGLAGREGEILRTTAIACLTYAAAGGLLLAWLV